MDISQLNSMDRSGFQNEFGNVFEYHPEAADYCYNQRPFKDIMEVVECFSTYFDRLSSKVKLQILQHHPVLGSKKPMTADSVNEQKSAGLNKLEELEAEILERMNQEYYAKFGFPFIICVAENSKASVLQKIQERINNDQATEILQGIDEVKKIAKHRLLGKIN